MLYTDAETGMGQRRRIRQKAPTPRAARASGRVRLYLAGLLAVTLGLFAAAAQSDGRVVLAPTADADMDAVLADNLTLPLLFDTEPTAQDLALDIAAEARKMTGLMRAYGYLTARVEVTGAVTESDPLILTPKAGELYSIGWIRVDGIGAVAPEVTGAIETFIDAQVGQTATDETLDGIRAGVAAALRRGSYGHAEVPSPEVTVDPGTATAGVALAVEPGAALTFGNTYFTGSFRLNSAEAAALVPYRAGDPFSGEAIDALRSALEETNRFRRVRIELDETPNPIGQTDIHVDLRDRAPDVVELARSSGFGPKLLILTMLTVVLMECLRVTPLWSRRTVRRGVTAVSAGMIGASVPVVVLRLAGFLY